MSSLSPRKMCSPPVPKTLAPIEVLATREPLLFAKCGPMYGFLVCERAKNNVRPGCNFQCRDCVFVSLVRLLSTSTAMREAARSCVFRLSVMVYIDSDATFAFVEHCSKSTMILLKDGSRWPFSLAFPGRTRYQIHL